jgi:NADPH:quinone reductase-like Zn-dependent oxidoreductase
MHTTPANEEHILALVARKVVQPVIADIFPIARAADAHRQLADHEITGKIVLAHDR